MKQTQGLSCFALVMLITGAIDSVRNLPAAAMFGSSLFFFFVFATIVFLLPSAIVSAELSSTWTEDGGIYGWVKRAFGEEIAFLAIWLQWVNTLVWYPTILSFIAGTAAYLINPHLIDNRLYLVIVILSTFWGLTWINLRGLHTSARIASFCTIFGMLIPMVLIVILGGIWMVMGHPLQIHFTTEEMIPNLHSTASWSSLTAMITAFLGIELATAHVREVNNPERTLPKAIMISTLIIMLTMVFASLSIAVVLPYSDIHLVDGVMQAFERFLAVYHLQFFTPLMTATIVIGSVGSMINWMIAPARGLHFAARQGYLPPIFRHENEAGVPSTILIAQAVVVTVLSLVFMYMPSVNSAYWLLTDLSTQMYILMYVLMFLAAIKLRFTHLHVNRPFKIPGGAMGFGLICGLGIFGCLASLIVGFIPPPQIFMGNGMSFQLIVSCGLLAMLIPVFFCYQYALVRVEESV